MYPKARKVGLSVRSLGDELVVIDQKKGVTHHLNSSVAMVWRSCDGRRSKEDLASLFARDATPAAATRLVEAALSDLDTAGLLVLDRSDGLATSELSRRQAIRKLAVAGITGIALPAVTTAILSSPAQAANNCPNQIIPIDMVRATPDLARQAVDDQIRDTLSHQVCFGTCTDASCVQTGLTIPDTEVRKALNSQGQWTGNWQALCTITVRCGCRHSGGN